LPWFAGDTTPCSAASIGLLPLAHIS